MTQATPAKLTLDQQLQAINMLIQQDQSAKAMPMLEKLLQVPNAQMPAKALMGLALAMDNKADDARAMLEALPKAADMGPVELLLTTGSAWLRLGDAAESVGYLKAAPENASLWQTVRQGPVRFAGGGAAAAATVGSGAVRVCMGAGFSGPRRPR